MRWRRGFQSLEEQERRDRVPAGAYRTLEHVGRLTVDVGLRVQSTSSLWAAVRREWGLPALVICDRFRLGELLDVVQDMVPVQPRVTRWSDASADIRSLRKLVKDGPLAVSQESRSLIAASLATATVKSDDQGSSRLVKGSGNVAQGRRSGFPPAGRWGIHERFPTTCAYRDSRGGMSGVNRLNRRQWAHARRAALERDGMEVHENAPSAGRLEVDHVQPLDHGGQPFDLENLRTLCVSCHLDVTWAARVTPEQRIWRAYSRKIDSKAVL